MQVSKNEKPNSKDMAIFHSECVDSIHLILLDTTVPVTVEQGKYNNVTEEYSGHTVYFPLTVNFENETVFARYDGIYSVDDLLQKIFIDEKVSKFIDGNIKSSNKDYDSFKRSKDKDVKDLVEISKNLESGVGKFNPSEIFMLPDYYEPSMHCICIGNENFDGEEDYDDRVIIPSVEKEIGESLLNVIKYSSTISSIASRTYKMLNNIEQKIIAGFASDKKIKTAIEILNKKKSHSQKVIDEYKKNLIIERSRRYAKNKTSVKDPQKLADIVTKMEGFISDIKLKVDSCYIDEKTNKFILKEDIENPSSEQAVVAVLKVVEDLKNQIEECV